MYKLKRTVTYKNKEILKDSIFADKDMDSKTIEKLLKKGLVEKIIDSKDEKSNEQTKNNTNQDKKEKDK